jgi:glutaredoxin
MSNWVDIQQNAFTRWMNEHLKKRGYHVNNLQKDLCDGILLINLLEIISNKSLGKYNRNPRIPPQKLENNSIAINFMKSEGLKLVNIGPEDITDGKIKLILGLLWTLILRYQIQKGDDINAAKNDLLKWVNSKIPEYGISNFQKDWNDGRAICALVNALDPGSCPNHRSLNPQNGLENATKGINLGYDNLGVPKIIQPTEMIHPKVDELAMMTYISYYRDLDGKKSKIGDASKCKAYGSGLVQAIMNEPAEFLIENPGGKGKLEIKVEGSKSQAKVNVKNNGDGTYNVSYTPTEPGIYLVHVTLDGVHIPGSIFKVTVLSQISLGGEGKIRVYYTTTTATNEKSRPLQELLESKKVHLRPDFEPWIPVDVMEKPDREAVFKKAGTRTLPIVFIDDVYIGDYYKVKELNETGELDRLLKYNERDSIMKNNIKTTTTTTTTTTNIPKNKNIQQTKINNISTNTSTTNFCSNCGTKFGINAKFCSECGKSK